MKLSRFVLVFFSATVVGLSPAYAVDSVSDACSRIVRDCFSSEAGKQSSCLFNASQHPFCEGTTVGKLSYRRWAMDPMKAPGVPEDAAAFLGPQLIDQECLKKFDNAFFTSLIEGSPQVGTLSALDADLKRCAKNPETDLSRP